MSSDVIAMSIVLLPEDAAMAKIMEINTELQGASGVLTHPFHPRNCLPHITLNMCGVAGDEISIVRSRLLDVVAGKRTIPIEATLHTKSVLPSLILSDLRVEAIKHSDASPDPIQRLHEIALGATEGLEVSDVPLSAYVQSEDLTEETVQWTSAFRQSVQMHGFHPHITLNAGDLQRKEIIECVCDRIAICQLGNYCTCRSILFEHPLTR